MANLLDVFDASELDVSIGTYDTLIWTWNKVDFRRNVNPEIPDNDRRVYNKLTLRGTKKQRGENTLTIESEFQGFKQGLLKFEETNALCVKIEIIPNEGALPVEVDGIQYYYNWNTPTGTWSAPDEGEFNVTLAGAFDTKHDVEPVDNIDWVETV